MRRLLSSVGLALLAWAHPASAQVRPDLEWRTLTTAHFRVHFSPGLEPLARRTAANAELAWTRLASELTPPRGPVDLVLADNVDFPNGYATPVPSNRIVIYARPPVEVMSLRNHEDWNLLVVTHELTHIFQLDRTGGWWRIAQGLFGRAAPFFPNLYAPSWILEGTAVHYESRFGGGGRLAGTEFAMLARAAARDGLLPPLDALSQGTPHFPGGNAVYLYGAFAMTRDDTARMPAFIERSSRRLIPWFFDANAREAFGISFTQRWAVWRDSVTRAESGLSSVAAGIHLPDLSGRELTSHRFTARFPRFLSGDTLMYVAEDGRQSPGLYRLDPDGARRRLARRITVDASASTAGGGRVYADLDYADPYSLRSDLVREDGGRRRWLTREARLSHADVHPRSGRIVAVRTDPGTTSLVLLDSSGAPTSTLPDGLRPIAAGSLDRTWSEPRWSTDGSRIATVLWERGGRTSVVVMDSTGEELRRFSPRGPRLTVVSSPVWVPGDTTVLFVSDHEGRAMIYRGDVRTGEYGLVWSSPTGLNTPDVSADGRRIVAVELRGNGYRVVTRAMPGEVPLSVPAADSTPVAEVPVRVDSLALETRYRPGVHLWPTWWLPVAASTDLGTLRLGAMTTGRDLVGRHAYAGSVSLEAERRELSFGGSYEYAGLGNPLVVADASRDWEHGAVRNTNTGAFLGYLAQESRQGGLSLVVQRPRARLSSSMLVGGEFEQVAYRTYPSSLLGQLTDPRFRETRTTSGTLIAVALSTMQRPLLALSPEDGISLSVSQRRRFGAGINGEDLSEAVAAASATKSLPLPGFSRHVVAVRGAYGETGAAARSSFSAGGVSGMSLELAPGIAIGGEPRTFFVRGFEGGSQSGVRAAAASAEYRAPLTLLGRGLRLLPLYFQKASVLAFADVGAAWCPRAVAGSFACRAPLAPRTWMRSVGAELALDASISYDAIYRFRLGIARPVDGRAYALRAQTIYFTLGGSF